MKVNRNSFILVSEPDPHIERRAKILENYPEIRQLIGPNPYSMLLIILLVTLQLTLAWVMSSQHWLVSLLTAFFIGAYITGSLNALIHETTIWTLEFRQNGKRNGLEIALLESFCGSLFSFFFNSGELKSTFRRSPSSIVG